ncbi:MAG: hypothetical protein KatS3mg060_3577 [Dehalococcoidia bacterium]|nr:MAG: hypothetical protein KatS3mg060_3577 [Dehalococcoidia bacterium]
MRNLLDGIDAPDPQTVWPGIGRFDSTTRRWHATIRCSLGQFFVAALGVVLANLITDLTYAVLDPRVRLR